MSYKTAIGYLPKNNNKKTYDTDFAERLLARATHYRDFEIEMSWKRAGYFVLFLSAIFIAYYTIKSGQNTIMLQQTIYGDVNMISQKASGAFPQWLVCLLMGLGTLISYIWYLVNRGSKQTYENWEWHIDFIEKEYQLGTISRHHFKSDLNFWNLLKTYPISASRANNLVSLLITLSFLIVFLYECGALKCIKLIMGCCFTQMQCLECLSFWLFFCALWAIPYFLKSNTFSEQSTKSIELYDRISGDEETLTL